MTRFTVFALAFLGAAPVLAQPAPAAPRFKWEAGKVHTYRVVQQTIVKETVLDEKSEKPVATEAKTSLVLVRKWTVKDVDKQGVATLEMSIAEMKQEFRQPDGSTTTTDSAKPEDAKAMAEYLNKPIVTVRIDAQGKLVEVKEAKGGAAARLQAELPFRLVLPDAAPEAGKTWDRPFAFKLDPPAGTGESYDFTQKYTNKGTKDGYLIVGVETALKAPPKTTGEQVPLVPMLWTGDVYFNTSAGKYQASRLSAKAELANHQGEGTKFVYESTYAEDCLDK
ncbi:hypothetical protein GobsT_69220 [Gemmata obscuriglobus]|uniref:DUF4412 domain-containing protein n=1 Tax=Gemmata obscuriglobus TaxID=114 RepID=A0A2Z3HDX0_9BACT|nr:hypothetical protein [Gemmata obscuriglobus]AWM41946.1 hypothetical protein C1280_36455 [Gemmata obscuriglobus]QEG32072.1 hypothetical protein GobsT_69220 [Gemmata obscuriglobus]VTS11423.1 Marine sediment metagenome DNA, contig: S01H1_S00476 OS=marine sediment metagenome GN=S01H1_25281 PE=4 SV=1 [Gemmata obscuriglobus UQM 2246]